MPEMSEVYHGPDGGKSSPAAVIVRGFFGRFRWYEMEHKFAITKTPYAQ
jgi:hypothetical protein